MASVSSTVSREPSPRQAVSPTPHMSILHGLCVRECGCKRSADAAAPLRQASSRRSGSCPSPRGRAFPASLISHTPSAPGGAATDEATVLAGAPAGEITEPRRAYSEARDA
jgi:hypothetical protein